MFLLIAVAGPDKGRVFELFEGRPVVVGREGDQHKLRDRQAADAHARIWCEGPGEAWFVRDLRSVGGTWLNGKPARGRKRIEPGDLLGMGGNTFVLAELPVEQSERMYLLGEASARPASYRFRRWRRVRRFALAAGLTGLGVLIGLAWQPAPITGPDAVATRAAESDTSGVALRFDAASLDLVADKPGGSSRDEAIGAMDPTGGEEEREQTQRVYTMLETILDRLDRTPADPSTTDTEARTSDPPRDAVDPLRDSQSRADRPSGEGSPPTESAERLTALERAYRRAFETDQPVTVGAGVVNPVTGERSTGRTLDPAAARAAGITSWREWYVMDAFAERMRLQRQAASSGGRASRSPIVTLPPAIDTVNALPAVDRDSERAR